MGKSKWSLVFFICGAFLGSIATVSALSAIGGQHFAPIISRIYGAVGPSLTKAGIVLTFLLLLSIVGIAGGILLVWVGDRLTSFKKSA